VADQFGQSKFKFLLCHQPLLRSPVLILVFIRKVSSVIVLITIRSLLIFEVCSSINEVHIEENIGISKDYNVFELINAVGARNVEKANRIVDYFDHNPKATSIIVVISNLFNHYSRLMRIHFLQNKSKDSVASSLKVHPFVAGELVNSSKIYNPKKIAANIAVLHEYDLKSKGVGNASFTHGQLMKELIFRLMH